MPKYQIKSGKTYTIPESEVENFLSVYPDAVLIEEQGKESAPAKETAAVGAMTESQNAVVEKKGIMALPSDEPSLELPEAKIDPTTYKSSKAKDKVALLQKEYGDQYKITGDDNVVTFENAKGNRIDFNLTDIEQATLGTIGSQEAGGSMGSQITPASTIEEINSWAFENSTEEDEAYNFVTAGIQPSDYATILDPQQRSQVSGASFQSLGTRRSDVSIGVVDAQQQRNLIDVTQGEIQRMYKNPGEFGIVEQPSVYSAGFDAYTEEEQIKNLDLIYNSVKNKSGLNISKDSFVKIYDNVFSKSIAEAAKEIDKENQTRALSQERLNPKFEKELAGLIEQDFNYTPQEKNRINLLNAKDAAQAEIDKLNPQLLNADAQKTQTINEQIDAYKGTIANIEAAIKKNATTVSIAPTAKVMPKAEVKVDPELAAKDAFEREQAMNLVNIASEENPQLTGIEAARKAYEDRVLQLQMMQSQSVNDFITLDFSNPLEVQSETPGLTRKLSSQVLSTLTKNGYTTDKSGKIEMSLFNLISLGVKPEQLNGVGIKTDEKDVLKLRMFKEMYDENYTNAKSIKRLIDLRQAPEVMKKAGFVQNFLQSAAVSLSTEILGFDKKEAEKIASLGQGERTRVILDNLNQTLIEEGVLQKTDILNLTEKDLEAFERSFLESTSEGLGQMTPILAKIAFVNAASGGVLGMTGAANALAKLYEGDKYSKMIYHGAKALIEEVNMQMAGLKPTSGAAFYTTGTLFKRLAPFDKTLRSFKPIYEKAIAGPSGAVGMEVAGITEAAYDDLMDNKDFSAAFNELYGDLDEVGQRVMLNTVMFNILGFKGLKKTDLQSTNTKIYTRGLLEAKLEKQVQEQKPQEEIESTYKEIAELQKLIAYETGAADLNPKSPTYEADVKRIYVEPLNKAIAQQVPGYKGIVLKVGEGKQWRDANGLKENENGKYVRSENIIYLDKSRPNALSVLFHEAAHASLDSYFEANPQAKETFNTNVAKIFENQVIAKVRGKELIGKDLKENVDKTYKEENLNDKDLAEEYIAQMIEQITNPEFYFTQYAPSFISEIRNEFRRRMDYVGLDGAPLPETAADLIRAFSSMGYESRVKGEFNPNLLASLGNISLFQVESGELAEAKSAETVIDAVTKNAEQVKSKRLNFDKLQETYDLYEGDLSSQEAKIDAARAGAPVIMSAANRVWGMTPRDQLRNGKSFNDVLSELSTLYMDVAATYKPELDKNNQGIDRQTSTLFNLRANAIGKTLGLKEGQREVRSTEDNDVMAKVEGYDYYSAETEAFESMDLSFGKNKAAEQGEAVATVDGMIDLPVVLELSPEIKQTFIEAVEQSGIPQSDLNYKTLQAFNEAAFLEAIGVYKTKTGGARKGKVDTPATREAMVNWLKNPINAETLYRILPLSLRKTPTGDKGLSQTTGIKDSVLKRLYTKTQERAKYREGNAPSGAIPQVKNPFIIDGKFQHQKFLDVLFPEGIDNISGADYRHVEALFAELGKATYNRTYREYLESKGETLQELQRIKDGSSDELFSKKLDDFSNFISTSKDASAIREKLNDIILDPLVTLKDKVKLLLSRQINNAWWNENMSFLNDFKVRDLANKFKGSEFAQELVNLYKENLTFLNLRRNNKDKLDQTNVGLDVSGGRAKRLQDVSFEIVQSLIPKNKTFADLSKNEQQNILETLGVSHSSFKINGQKITYKDLGVEARNKVAWFDAFFEGLGEGKASEIKGTGDVNATSLTGVSSSRIRVKANNFIEDILNGTPPEQAINKFKKDFSAENKTFKETNEARQNLLVDFYNNIATQLNNVLNTKGKEAAYEYLNGAMDFLQLQSARGYGINRAMVPFDVLSIEFGKTSRLGDTKGRVEHFTPVAKQNQIFIENALKFIEKNDYTFENFLQNTEISVRSMRQGLISEAAREVIDAGGNTVRKFLDAFSEVPRESLEKMFDLSGDKVENIADLLAAEVIAAKISSLETPKSALEAEVNAIVENFEGYNKNKAEIAKILEQRTKEPVDLNNTTTAEVFSEMEILEDFTTKQDAAEMKSKKLSKDFNEFIETKTGINVRRKFSKAEAQAAGKKSGKIRLIASSAQDFEGLNYRVLGKGKEGERQQQWFEENLYQPLNNAELATATYRKNIFEDFRTAKKELKVKGLKDKVANTEFTQEQAVRVYIWNKQEMDIPGMTAKEISLLTRHVKNDPNLRAFGDKLIYITKQDGYVKPNEAWALGSITTDINQGIRANTRQRFLKQFISNAEEIYSPENLNKLEAAFGTGYRKTLEKTLKRIITGRNRLLTGEVDPDASKILNYINNSVGVVMFLNSRSATLQLTSATNFINYSDNNIFEAGKAFANQPQYWKDFVKLFNSDYLRDRRGGNKINIVESEIAEVVGNSKNKAAAAVSYILNKGFLPTQFADSFAIASGGASFYRNRIKTYLKQGMELKDAEAKAYKDFYDQAEKSQQSSKPQRISEQQAGPIGRVVLAFANTPSQYARLMEKAALDLINNRGSKRENAGKLLYYATIQNLMFNYLQQATFALLDQEEQIPNTRAEAKQKEEEFIKNLDLLNGMSDSILRGLGWQGAAFSALKNTAFDIYKRTKKDQPNYKDAYMEMLDFAPPISSKLKRMRGAFLDIDRAGGFEKAAKEPLNLENPYITAAAKLTSATTNFPLDRALVKNENIQGALNEQYEDWQRLMMFLGWSDWQLGIKDKDEKEGGLRRKIKDNIKLKGIKTPKIKI